MKRRRNIAGRDSPPWRRYVVFDPDGVPTGWAMGMSQDHAIRHWLSLPNASESAIAEHWRSSAAQGYSVRAVLLTPAPEDAAEGKG